MKKLRQFSKVVCVLIRLVNTIYKLFLLLQ